MTEHIAIFSKFCNTPEDTFCIYCQSLNVWIQQSQSETNGLMSAAPAFDPSDRWLALSLFPSQTWRAEKSSLERTLGSVLLLSDFYLSGFRPDPVQVTFSAGKPGLSHRALILIWSPSASCPLLDPPSHHKVTISATFFATVASAG